MTAQDLIKNEANMVIEEFKKLTYTNSVEVLCDYNNDLNNFKNLPENFSFKKNKSDGHEKLAQMLIDGYNSLKADIKKQYKMEFFKNIEKRCPFCGQLLESSGKADSDVPTADLDHFFPKCDFPQFALFPPNLIPTCMECNRIEKHTDKISPKEFKLALQELNLLNDFQNHPNKRTHFRIYSSLSFDCNNKLFIKTTNIYVQKLIKLYGLEERYNNIRNKSFQILWSMVHNFDIQSPESLENFLNNMASSNWHEINDGYSLNNSPQIWQEFIENILYDECKLMALWEEVKSINMSIF